MDPDASVRILHSRLALVMPFYSMFLSAETFASFSLHRGVARSPRARSVCLIEDTASPLRVLVLSSVPIIWP